MDDVALPTAMCGGDGDVVVGVRKGESMGEEDGDEEVEEEDDDDDEEEAEVKREGARAVSGSRGGGAAGPGGAGDASGRKWKEGSRGGVGEDSVDDVVGRGADWFMTKLFSVSSSSLMATA
jgi:hypothetical protein